MLFRSTFLEGIRDGTVTLAFRRWRRPTVKAGGSLLTPVGELRIGRVDVVTLEDIGEADARRAGYASRAALVDELRQRAEGEIHRIELGPLSADRRIALREALPDDGELAALRTKLVKLDASVAGGGEPWTRRTLELLRDRPAVRAADLCRVMGQEKDVFKTNVRKLKALGLTESLEVGYRVSPRGLALLEAWGAGPDDGAGRRGRMTGPDDGGGVTDDSGGRLARGVGRVSA